MMCTCTRAYATPLRRYKTTFPKRFSRVIRKCFQKKKNRITIVAR